MGGGEAVIAGGGIWHCLYNLSSGSGNFIDAC